ncbi:MAG: AMP-binding protein [Deltaproteobacteria bacterium]|nr:AMP-binding protein [Deltaproteobacteria bacterium]
MTQDLNPMFKTIDETVERWAEREPGRIFAHFWAKDGSVSSLTYGHLLERSQRFAALLAAHGVRAGEVVVLIQEQDADLVASFVGAILHGAYPSIFAFPSPKISREIYLNTLDQLLQHSAARAVIASARFTTALESLDTWREGVALLPVSAAKAHVTRSLTPRNGADEIAFLQHSSGTTGLKKGVALSHRAVITQLSHLTEALHLSTHDHIISWLPLYHDMGLIACFLLPLCSGVPVTMIDPFDWARDPALLFDAIHAHRGSLCWLPNFAYNFLATRARERPGACFDLSTMRAFINCAEPISARSHETFRARFEGACGLRPEALCSSYAMAENTFAVTQGGISSALRVERLDEDVFQREHTARLATATTTRVKEVVSSGELLQGNRVRIVNAGQPLQERRVGEIVIHSDSLFGGYFNREDLTHAVLDDAGWYFSGDLGYLAGGQLFVTGRRKDLIIVAGKNIYPGDIEEVVSSVQGVVPGRVVAFGVPDDEKGTEQVVVVAETRQALTTTEAGSLRLAISSAIRQDLDCVAKDVQLRPHLSLLKSSSGKIARDANRACYLKGLSGPKPRSPQHAEGDTDVRAL